ncbi:hypothetical protein F2S73_11290 [Pseudomonas syringae pv. actinidiae]|nr:hypothetical protein [Pseudomonas syringae pv. actinidiae]NVL47279.1 hypothetical protein [Pseudomonas syringae pv. actinidiae]
MQKSRLFGLLTAGLLVALSLSANAAQKDHFNVCWTIYAGWMPWEYAGSQGIVDKWAKKYGIKIDVTQLNDYVESINQYTAGQFDGCTMTNMDALTIPAAGGVESTALIVSDFSNGNDGIVLKGTGKKVADLKGMKIRVQGNPVFIETINDMGGNGIAMATGEIFSALQTGVIDGAENNPPTYFQHNHYQNAKFFTMTEHLILPEPIVMSKATWEKLNPEQQALVKKLAREAQMEERALWDKSSADAEVKLKAAGVEFITLTPELKKAFYDATQPVRDKFGAPYKDLISRIEAVQTNPALAAASTQAAQ